MKFFQRDIVNMEKIKKEDTIQYFIDYHKKNKPDAFLADTIYSFMEDKESLVVIDTDQLYDKNLPDIKTKIMELQKELDQRQIPWQQIVTMKESDVTILGFKMQNQPKRSCYQIGLAVMPKQQKEIMELLKDYNVFIYTYRSSIRSDILLKQFMEAKGEYKGLSAGAHIVLYCDRYLKRLGIFGRQDDDSLMKEKLAGINKR